MRQLTILVIFTAQSELDSIFTSLQPAFVDLLNKSCALFDVLANDHLQRSTSCQLIKGSPESQVHSPMISEVVEAGWEAQKDVGMWRREFHAASGRRMRFFSTSSVLNWMGYDPEDFYAKMQRRELSMHMTQFEFVAHICDNIIAGHKPLTCRVYRYRATPGRCLFVQVLTTRTFDSFGRLLRVEEIMRPLSVEEVNKSIERDPKIVCATYMGSDQSYAGAGTKVDAQTLLASVEEDFEKGKIGRMMNDSEGRALLQGLMDRFAASVAPAMQAADKILTQSEGAGAGAGLGVRMLSGDSHTFLPGPIVA